MKKEKQTYLEHCWINLHSTVLIHEEVRDNFEQSGLAMDIYEYGFTVT